MKIYSSVLAMLFACNMSYAAAPIETKIVGGIEASIGEFPFIVSLQSNSYGHFCGGSLIRANWVLTAGHCVGDGVDKVVIGLHNLNDARNAETFRAKRVIRHPQYNEQTTDYDFALIELSGNSRYQPIEMNTAEIPVPNGSEILATVAGWGATKETSSTLPARLQKVEVPLISATDCNKSYRGIITNRMMCAGYTRGGKDSCQGDSGGPLVAKADDKNTYLIGTVSWGEGCARAGKPGVYGKVSQAISWIAKYVK